MLLPLRSAVYVVDLSLAEEVPVDSSFAVVDEVEIDQRVEFAHFVETVVAAASADVVDLEAASLTIASGAAFVMDFDSSASVGVVAAH